MGAATMRVNRRTLGVVSLFLAINWVIIGCVSIDSDIPLTEEELKFVGTWYRVDDDGSYAEIPDIVTMLFCQHSRSCYQKIYEHIYIGKWMVDSAGTLVRIWRPGTRWNRAYNNYEFVDEDTLIFTRSGTKFARQRPEPGTEVQYE